MSGPPYIFAFYSFKGGVGRTMSLLNSAYALAGRGRHVLMLDLDLEAPGLSDFLNRKSKKEISLASPCDIVDLLAKLRATAKSLKPDQKTLDKSLKPIPTDYIASIDPNKLEDLKPELGDVGRLDVIYAKKPNETDEIDEANDYYDRLSRLDLASMGREEIISLGNVLRAWLRSLTVEVPVPFYYGVGPTISVPYDYILIDSRTGISEIGGLCLGPLSDRLVVLTSLNIQNIQGTHQFLREVGITKTREKGDELWDAADVEFKPKTRFSIVPQRLGPKPTILVASPIPLGDLEATKNRLNEVLAEIGPVANKISYHPQLALLETIFVRDWQDEYLALEYSKLADNLMAMVNDHASQLQQVPLKDLSDQDRKDFPNRCLRSALHRPDEAISGLIQIAEMEETSDVDFRFKDRACRMLAEAKGRVPLHVALVGWGSAFSDQAKQKSGSEADGLFGLAGEKYAAALQIKPDYHEAFYNWGNALNEQAKQKAGSEADCLIRLAGEKYAAALHFLMQANQKLVREAAHLLEWTSEKLFRVEELVPGSAAFNLACVFALQGHESECQRWLEISRANHTLPSVQHLLEDRDLASFREREWFQALISSLKSVSDSA